MPRGRPSQCYKTKRTGTSPQAGTPIPPWAQREPVSDGEVTRFSTPRSYQPPHLVRLKERLAAGRATLPRLPSTVSTPASSRVAWALGSLQVFDAVESDATAYDATIGAGPDHIVVATNFKAGVLSKSTGTLIHEVSLRAWFSRVLPAEIDFVFDPRVLYDQHDGHWVLVASGVHHEGFTNGLLLLSVSRTSDPLQEWWVWAFPEATATEAWWPDHPSLGVDAHALYLSVNRYIGLSGKPGLARLRVIPKAGPYAGGPVAYTDFEELTNPVDKEHPKQTSARTVFPCHTWGAPGVEYLISTRRDLETERTVVLWALTDAAGDPELACKPVTVLPYVFLLPPVAQKDGPPIDAGDARVRNAVFSGGSLWFSFAASDQPASVDTADGVVDAVGVVWWHQLDPASGPVQQGHFAVPGVHHSYPAIVPDMHGNAVLVIGRCSSNEFVSAQVTARRASDPPNQIPPSRLLHAGLVGHEHKDDFGRNRWGDYHAAALDPADGVTIWVYGGYPISKDVWGTAVGALRV